MDVDVSELRCELLRRQSSYGLSIVALNGDVVIEVEVNVFKEPSPP